MVGEVGADPTIPEVTDLQSAAVADLLLSRIGAQGEIRTHTPSRAVDFESTVATITPLEHNKEMDVYIK